MSHTKGWASRRAVLQGGAALAAAAAGLLAGPAAAGVEDARKALAMLTGGAVPVEGRITLSMPQVADNGATVPMTITVDSPMTPQDHVTAVVVVADGNPAPEVAVFRFSPEIGVVDVNVRVRMAKTQSVIAVAQMNDGSAYIARAEVKVTVGGCTT
ncbi:thiosulfate oxidation carrier protein SoxY [Azospirillum halopraeferens]|uniref:thiosulfate oxidation carrier protein SoxY n=1 Tax=Azospirillum halopraeferens TaxID=34010 RepID=UPI000427E4FF|nr:thiosulfate oxidation carrier protein SoxY [Azospirillum halopraeferens]